MNHSILQEIVILLAVSVVAVTAFRRLQMPPVLAYLFVGILVGPHGWSWIEDSDNTHQLAEFGVVFLLFTLGLEFSLAKMIAMRKEVLGFGGAQVLITTILIGFFAWIFGATASAAFVIGGALALSSTAIVIKQLGEQLELNSRHGRFAVAILLFQDIAVVPFLIIIPALSSQGEHNIAFEVITSLLKGAVVLAAMLATGHWVLRPLFRNLARYRSSELFTLTVLLFALSAAWFSSLAGLSLALGAFLAGMMLGETEFRHQVEAEIKPLRDVLLGLFFVSIGMLLDIQILPEILPWVLLLLVSFVLLKIVIIGLLAKKMTGTENGVALRTGIVLAQGGEFGFALLALALNGGAIDGESVQIVLAAAIFSMILTPFMIKYNGLAAKRIFSESYGASREKIEQEIAENASALSNHVVICGFGRIGQNVAQFLEKEGFPYTALDLDAVVVREAREAGKPVNYGDSTHIDVLLAAGLERANTIVLSYDDVIATLKIIQQVRQRDLDIPILVRTRDESHLTELQDAGATEIIPETLEASLMLSSSLMLRLGVPMKRVVRQMQEIRRNRYQGMQELFLGEELHDVSESPVLREGLHCVTLNEGAFAISKKVEDMNLGNCNVKLTSIRRGEQIIENPETTEKLEKSDVLVLYGTPENLERAENKILVGAKA